MLKYWSGKFAHRSYLVSLDWTAWVSWTRYKLNNIDDEEEEESEIGKNYQRRTRFISRTFYSNLHFKWHCLVSSLCASGRFFPLRPEMIKILQLLPLGWPTLRKGSSSVQMNIFETICFSLSPLSIAKKWTKIESEHHELYAASKEKKEQKKEEKSWHVSDCNLCPSPFDVRM